VIDQAASPYSPPLANLDSGATQAIGTLTMATAGSRLAAKAIDVVFMLPGVVGCFLIAQDLVKASPGEELSLGRRTIVVGAATIAYFLALAVYQSVLLSKHGQTIGKRARKIRIVKMDGSSPGFVHAVLLRAIVNGLPSLIPHAGRPYGLIDILFIFRKDRRCIHDLIAGTRVVQIEGPAAGMAPLAS